MRINYPFTFRDGGGIEDSEKSGHLISASFGRFLLSLASDYHTFYSGDDRVSLTDTERQILESGIRDLTVKSVLSEIVLEANLPAIAACAPGTALLLPFVPATVNEDYITWDETNFRAYFSRAGLYQVVGNVLIHNSTVAGSYSHQFQFRRNGTVYVLRTSQRVNQTDSIHGSWFIEMGGGQYLDWRYVNNNTGSIIAQLATLTSIQVVRYG